MSFHHEGITTLRDMWQSLLERARYMEEAGVTGPGLTPRGDFDPAVGPGYLQYPTPDNIGEMIEPVIDPAQAEAYGRQAPGLLGDVAGPTLGAASHLSDPLSLGIMVGTAGLGIPLATLAAKLPYAGRVLAPLLRPFSKSFPKALGAEAAVGTAGVLGAQEVAEHSESLPDPIRIPLTIAGGIATGMAAAVSPSLAKGVIKGGRIVRDAKLVEDAIDDAFIKSQQTAEDPSFGGTVDPGGFKGETIETTARFVDGEPETAARVLPALEPAAARAADDIETTARRADPDAVIPDAVIPPESPEALLRTYVNAIENAPFTNEADRFDYSDELKILRQRLQDHFTEDEIENAVTAGSGNLPADIVGFRTADDIETTARTGDLSYEEAEKNLNKRLIENLDAEEAEDAEISEMLRAAEAGDAPAHLQTREQFRVPEGREAETEVFIREHVGIDKPRLLEKLNLSLTSATRRQQQDLLDWYIEKYPELRGVTIGGLKETAESGQLKNTGVARIVFEDGKIVPAESQLHLTSDAGLVVTRHEIEHLLDAIHVPEQMIGRQLGDESVQQFGRFDHGTFNASDYLHRQKVEEAVRTGIEVPENVLADYPDLRNQAKDVATTARKVEAEVVDDSLRVYPPGNRARLLMRYAEELFDLQVSGGHTSSEFMERLRKEAEAVVSRGEATREEIIEFFVEDGLPNPFDHDRTLRMSDVETTARTIREELPPSKTPQQILTENTDKFLAESSNRKKVVRDKNISDIEDPILRATNRQVEEARTRETLNNIRARGSIAGPASSLVGPSGSDGRRIRNTFELSDDYRIRNLGPIMGKFFRLLNATDARKLRSALLELPLSNKQRGLIEGVLSNTGFDQELKVTYTGTGKLEDQFGSPEELISFVRGQGRKLTAREAVDLTQRNTHSFNARDSEGNLVADLVVIKKKGIAADGTPLFELTERGYEIDPSKLGKNPKNEYEVFVETLILGQDRKKRTRQIMEIADEIFNQTDAHSITGRVTGAYKFEMNRKITSQRVDKYFKRSIYTADEAARIQDGINNWNRASSTDDAILDQMESDRLTRKILSGIEGGGDDLPPPPGSFTGWDPEDLRPRARAAEAALADSTENHSWEAPSQRAQRLLDSARKYEAASVAKGVREGAKFAKARGITEWNEENALPLFRALHNPDKWLDKLSPDMQDIYYDLKRNWVFPEENDMFTFLSFAAQSQAAQFKFDMENMASRFMAHPHYFNRLWRYFDQPEGDTVNKLSSTTNERSRDGRPGFKTTMEYSRNALSFDDMVDRYKFVPALWDPYKMAAQRRISGVEFRESIRFMTRLAERGLIAPARSVGGDPRWGVPAGVPVFNGRQTPSGVPTESYAVPTNIKNQIEQVWTSPDTLFSRPVLFNRSIRQWSTLTKLLKLAASPFQHVDMAWRAGGGLFTPTAIYSPMKRGGSDRLGLHGLKLPDRLGGKPLDILSIPTGRLPGPMKIPSLMVDMFKVQFFTSAREGLTDFLISPTRINKDYPLLWQDLVQKHGMNVHGDYSIIAEEMRQGALKVMQPRIDPETGMKVWLYPGAPYGAAKTMLRATSKLNEFFVSGLFDGVYSVVQKYAIENFILPAMRRNHPTWTVDQIGVAVAENSNMIFSALGNWQTFLKELSPELQQALHIAAFSAGETESLMRSASRAFVPRIALARGASSELPLGEKGDIKVNDRKGLPFWRGKRLVMSPHWGIHAEHMLGMFLVLAGFANIIHKFGTGGGVSKEAFEKGDWLHQSKYNPININDPYAVFGSVGYNGGFLSPLSPWGKGRNDTDVYLDLVGQQDTAFKWLLSPLDSISSRYNVLPRAIYNQMRGETFNQIPYNTPLQRVGALISDAIFPISAINAIAGLRKMNPEAFNISSVTLPGEERLSIGQMLAQGGGQNQKAIDSLALQAQIDAMELNDPMRRKFMIELEIRHVESAMAGRYNWGFISSATIMDAYEYWKGDAFRLEELDKAYKYLVTPKPKGAGRKNMPDRPRWRQKEAPFKDLKLERTLPSDTYLQEVAGGSK